MYSIRSLIHKLIVTALLVSLIIPQYAIAEEGKSYDENFYAGNDILFYNPEVAACSSDTNSPSDISESTNGIVGDFSKPGAIVLKGSNNAEKVMNFLLDHGLTIPAASGIMGNFSVESEFSPTALNKSSGAFGLAQWLGPRKINLEKYGGVKHNTLEIQLQFLMYELKTSEKASMAVNDETDPIQAAITWELKFERSGEVAVSQRSSRAKKIFDEWTKNKALSDSFLKTIGNGAVVSSGSGSLINPDCANRSGQTIFGKAELEGYAFPIAITKKSDIDTFGGALNKLPCLGICHHDGTFAFDLGVKGYGAHDVKFNPNSIGAPVYAISDGKIIRRKDNPNSVRTNCTQFSLLSSKDDHVWWYGHLDIKGAAVDEGQTVKVGQLLGYVGPSNCADNTAPHLHIDSGGGSVSTRNDLVSKVVNGLYTQIGE
ncbi:MAG: peptidoglycan DD-metalloendopeptidase family protein [Candidatus Saccharimonas sp.]|nr:peptidoglycan DD-metalloendopeptidase family protein [Candidatus Saccharimonas sp.]